MGLLIVFFEDLNELTSLKFFKKLVEKAVLKSASRGFLFN